MRVTRKTAGFALQLVAACTLLILPMLGGQPRAAHRARATGRIDRRRHRPRSR